MIIRRPRACILYFLILAPGLISPTFSFGEPVFPIFEVPARVSVNLDDYVPGELIVKFDLVNNHDRTTMIPVGLSIQGVKSLGKHGLQIVKLAEGQSMEDAMNSLKAMRHVVYIQPNFIYRACVIPNDPFFDNLWGLNNTGQTVNGISGTPDSDVDAPEAWELQSGQGNIVIAVIDTGVDYNHPEITGRIWLNSAEIAGNGIDDDGNGYVDDTKGWDFSDEDNNPMDPSGHGTHVAGIISATGNNGSGTTGLGWGLSIMPLKTGGITGVFLTTDLIEAIDYAIDNGAKIINASWGGNFPDQALKDSISRARASGTLFIAAAGNSGRDIDLSPFYPASYDLENIISVAASDQDDNLSPFSNYGVQAVDVSAPGSNILSTSIKRKIIWSDDFSDGNISDWTVSNANIKWDVTDEQANSDIYSLTDSPLSNYENNTFSSASRSLPLPGLSGTSLSGVIKGSSESINDFLSIMASPDGSIWQAKDILLGSQSGSSSMTSISGSLPWTPFEADMGSLDGKNGFFRFAFQTNGSVTDDGWYIDDLNVKVNDASTSLDVAYKNGTSMATPLVSALAGLIWSQSPNLSFTEVKNFILNGVDRKGVLTGKVLTGGRVNAYNSIPPLPPVNVVAISLSDTAIDISWTAASSNEEGFRIERKSQWGIFAEIADIGTPGTTFFSDTGLAPGTTYIYRVRSYTSAGASLYSAEASATTTGTPLPPPPPSGLSATASSPTIIDLNWKDNASNEAGFIIERMEAGGSFLQIVDIATPDVTTYSDTNLSPNTTYTYRVLSYNATGDSPFSLEVSETTMVPPSSGGGCSLIPSSSSPLTQSSGIFIPVMAIVLWFLRRKPHRGE